MHGKIQNFLAFEFTHFFASLEDRSVNFLSKFSTFLIFFVLCLAFSYKLWLGKKAITRPRGATLVKIFCLGKFPLFERAFEVVTVVLVSTYLFILYAVKVTTWQSFANFVFGL